jgi:hypothetical protein
MSECVGLGESSSRTHADPKNNRYDTCLIRREQAEKARLAEELKRLKVLASFFLLSSYFWRRFVLGADFCIAASAQFVQLALSSAKLGKVLFGSRVLVLGTHPAPCMSLTCVMVLCCVVLSPPSPPNYVVCVLVLCFVLSP